MFLHRPIVAFPIKGQIVLSGHRLKHFYRHTVRLIEFRCFSPIDRQASRPLHFLKNPLDVREATIDRFEEISFLALNHRRHAGIGFGNVRIGCFHQLENGRN